jgi:predicted Fe-Mo cluster-binding NifX family protein
MRVVVSAQDDRPEALVDPRFARAPWLIEIDTETNEWRAHDNSANRDFGGGAGVAAAHTVVELHAESLITGNVGPKAFRTLTSAGARVYLVEVSTVRDALERLAAGDLTPAESESVAGSWT